MFRLRVVPAQGSPFEHRLRGESTVIGRSSTSDLVIADRFLSRQHARLIVEEGHLEIEDLGSRNGTLTSTPAAMRSCRGN